MWFLFVVYHCMYYPFFGIALNLPLDETVEMVSCIHSMVAVVAACTVWLHRADQTHGIEVPEMLIYEHSLTYFVIDTVINMVWFRQTIYFLHHVVALIILIQMYSADVTGDAILLGIILFEITNPLKRFETLYLMHRDHSVEAKTSYARRASQIAFYVSFVIIRCSFIPWFLYVVHPEVTLKMSTAGKVAYTAAVILLIIGGALWSRDIMTKSSKIVTQAVRQHSRSFGSPKKD